MSKQAILILHFASQLAAAKCCGPAQVLLAAWKQKFYINIWQRKSQHQFPKAFWCLVQNFLVLSFPPLTQSHLFLCKTKLFISQDTNVILLQEGSWPGGSRDCVKSLIMWLFFFTRTALCSSVFSEHTGLPFLVCGSNTSAEVGHSLISVLLVSFQSTLSRCAVGGLFYRRNWEFDWSKP